MENGCLTVQVSTVHTVKKNADFMMILAVRLKFPFDLVLERSGFSQSLSSDSINKHLWIRPVSKMSLPTPHPLADLNQS